MSLSHRCNLSAGKIVLALIYILINDLFLWKYLPQYISDTWLLALCVTAYHLLVLLLLFLPDKITISPKTARATLFTVTCMAVVGLTIAMLQIDPAETAVARHAAINDWLTRLLDGRFPYSADARISGFPFLFILVLPFYLAGDPGLLQVLSLILFVVVLWRLFPRSNLTDLRRLILLVSAPVFLFEVLARSDLFSNMTIVLLLMVLILQSRWPLSSVASIVIGLTAGLLLSTRGIVLPLYLIFFGYFFRVMVARKLLMLMSMLVGFGLTLLPFLLWDTDFFIQSGPFAVQTLHIPFWLLAIMLLSSALCGVLVKTSRQLWFSMTIILFGTVAVTFLDTSFRVGFEKAVLRNVYDISYFCFCLPFLLVSLSLSGDDPDPKHGNAASTPSDRG